MDISGPMTSVNGPLLFTSRETKVGGSAELLLVIGNQDAASTANRSEKDVDFMNGSCRFAGFRDITGVKTEALNPRRVVDFRLISNTV
jgi:hypothetical protein